MQAKVDTIIIRLSIYEKSTTNTFVNKNGSHSETAIPKRRFVSAFSQLSWIPEHEKLLAKLQTNKLLALVCAVQLV